jgi:MFS family permease
MNGEPRKTINQYLLIKAVSTFGISFMSATYATFLISKGLDLFQVNLVNFMFFATCFFCEIPTGAFADVFGRKLSFIISCFLLSTGMLVYGVSDSFWGFVVAEVIAAIGSTFASGAFQAWMIDRLKHQGYSGSLSSIFAKEQLLRNGIGIAAAIIGAFLIEKHVFLPWIIGGLIMGLVGIIATIYMEEEIEFTKNHFSFALSIKSMVETVRASTGHCVNNKSFRFILVSGFVQLFAVQAANMQWQPFFGQFFTNKSNFGFIYAGISIALIIGSIIAPKFLKIVKNEKLAISLSQLGIGLCIAITTLFHSLLPALSIFLFHELFRGIFNPLKDVYLNDNIPSKERATLISIDSTSRLFGGMIGLLVSGAIAQYVSLSMAWIFSGLILTIATLIMIKNDKN